MGDLAFDIGNVKITNIGRTPLKAEKSQIVDSFDALRLLSYLMKVSARGTLMF